MMSKLVPAILGWLVVVITLALAPTIVTYNTAVTTNVAAAANAAYMIGMTAVDDFGGFIIIFGLLLSGGFFAVAGMKSKGSTVGDLLSVIGAVVLTVVSLAIFSGSIIGYIDSLVTAGAAGFEKTAYGILAIIVYIGIIGGASAYTGVKAYKKSKSGKKSNASSGGMY
jgi:hypothetical protein